MKTNKSIFTMIGVAALVAVIGLGLAGCGDKGDPSSPSGGDDNGSYTFKFTIKNETSGSSMKDIEKIEFFDAPRLYGQTLLRTINDLSISGPEGVSEQYTVDGFTKKYSSGYNRVVVKVYYGEGVLDAGYSDRARDGAEITLSLKNSNTGGFILVKVE